MKTTLVVVGSSLQINKLFLEYLDKHLSLQVKQIHTKVFLDKSDHNIMFTLEKVIEDSERLLIAADKDSFNFIGKVLSTLSEDNLELKGSTLTPSKALEYSEDSYLIEYQEKYINLFLAQSNKKLPEIFIKDSQESATFSLIGLDEDTAKLLLEPLVQTHEVRLITSSVVEGWSTLFAQSTKYGNLEQFLHSVKALFPDKFIFGADILEHIIISLNSAEKSITLAESCTGGRLASMLTSVSGSSGCFEGSVVSYSNTIKKTWLSVSEDTLKTYGAVSELCVREMMEGALGASGADYAMATSGIAGPSGGSKEKPVGTVFVGARSKDGEVLVEQLLLEGSREYIQEQSCYHALRLLLQVGSNIFF